MRGKGIDRILFHSDLREASSRETNEKQSFSDKQILITWLVLFAIVLAIASIL